ncbi:12756_t:CDS:2 [Entrophospora sp. SA101]|nr:12756_t:CDS:2 [Entrophospora sp. SA101]
MSRVPSWDLLEILDYFDITLPNQYSFLGYYQYRIKQIDFTFSFQKEAKAV